MSFWVLFSQHMSAGELGALSKRLLSPSEILRRRYLGKGLKFRPGIVPGKPLAAVKEGRQHDETGPCDISMEVGADDHVYASFNLYPLADDG